MKKILFFILVFTSNLCFAQIEVQKEELLEHQGIVTVSGKSANAIYDQLKIWAVTQFPNDSAVQLDDKENGKLILKGEQSFSFKAGIGHVPGRVHFTLTMEVKDDRYRYNYVITDITSDMDNGASMLPSLKRHPNNGRVKTVMNTIKDSLNDLIQKSYRSFDTSSDANW